MKTVVLPYLLQVYLNWFNSVCGNLLNNKPSTHPEGNDSDNSTCFLSQNAPLPYWQVDLQGYYHIDTVSISTCWGSWGWKAQSAEIEGFFSDPAGSFEAQGFLFGATPPDTEESQRFTFTTDVQFPVRYLRVSATVQIDLSLKEVSASGTPIYLSFSGELNKRVSNAASTRTVTSAGDCSRLCFDTDSCLAFSFIPDQEGNCLLSDCACVDEVPGWRTMTLDPRQAFAVSPCTAGT